MDLSNKVVVEVWNQNINLMGGSGNDALIGSGVIGMDGVTFGKGVGKGRGVEVVVELAKGSKKQGFLKMVVEAKKAHNDKGE